jgi:hypothetical protein
VQNFSKSSINFWYSEENRIKKLFFTIQLFLRILLVTAQKLALIVAKVGYFIYSELLTLVSELLTLVSELLTLGVSC